MSMRLKSLAIALIVTLICLAMTGGAYADDSYPARPVKLIVPYSPGGDTDLVARLWAGAAEKLLGVPIVVINKAGGSGAITADFVSRAKPDGYTIMAACNTPNMITPNFTKVSYSLASFAPICMFVSNGMGLAVRADSEFKTFDDFISAAKADPGRVSVSTYGATSAATIYSKIWSAALGIELKYVHYKGGAPAMVAMLGGHVDSTMNTPQTYGPHLKSKKAKLLFYTLKSKDPNVPTLLDYGVEGDFIGWNGLFAPAGTPGTIVKKLADVTREISKQPDIVKAITNTGGEVDFRTGPEWVNNLKKQYAEIAAVAASLKK